MNKSLEWIKNLTYKQIMAIYVLIVFGWNFHLFIFFLYYLCKPVLIVLGIAALIFVTVICLKKAWGIMLGIVSMLVVVSIGSAFLFSMNISLIIILGYWFMMTGLISGIFLLLCSIETSDIPQAKRKSMKTMGFLIILVSLMGIVMSILNELSY